MKYSLVFVLICSLTSSAAGQLCTGCYRYEAETGTRNGTTISTAVSGYSGTGYVTGFDSSGGTDSVSVSVDVPNGLYEMWVGYRSPYGEKGYNYRVDSEYGSNYFSTSSTFATDRAGIFNVTGGVNTMSITQNWGYYDVDYFEFRPFTPPALQTISSQLSDPLANQNTQMLMNYLSGIYGQKTLAGHQHQNSQHQPFPSSTYLSLSGGLKPAIRASDFIEYSPSRIAFGSNPNNESEESIAWAKANNGIISMSWHWNAPANLVNSTDWPWWKGFYTQGTTFDLAGAIANTNPTARQQLVSDIDAISRELLKFQDAGVPIIWRPLHEAQGNANGTSGSGAWFWWGASGPEVFKQLWRLMYNRLTTSRVDASFPGGVYPGLHNLIWEFTSSSSREGYMNWYPGDDVVDMVGLDIYTDARSSMSGEWYDILNQFNGRKIVALSESGTLPNGSLMHSYGPEWSYFSLWQDGFLDDFSAAQVQALLNDDKVITLNELPSLPWKNSAPIPGDYNHNGVVDAADYVVWRQSLGQIAWGLDADSDLNGRVDEVDYNFWRSRYNALSGSGSISGTDVPEPAAWTILLSALAWIFARRSHGSSSDRSSLARHR